MPEQYFWGFDEENCIYPCGSKKECLVQARKRIKQEFLLAEAAPQTIFICKKEKIDSGKCIKSVIGDFLSAIDEEFASISEELYEGNEWIKKINEKKKKEFEEKLLYFFNEWAGLNNVYPDNIHAYTEKVECSLEVSA
jgi:hypothetical protein